VPEHLLENRRTKIACRFPETDGWFVTELSEIPTTTVGIVYIPFGVIQIVGIHYVGMAYNECKFF
jgi:hypothetical protein